MFNFRLILAFAAFAFVISLLVGLLGGIPFGLILLRTLIGTAFFALLGAGASWVIRRYIPELLEVVTNERREAAATGDEVDIVLPAENPHIAAEGAEGSDDAGDEAVALGSLAGIEEESATEGEAGPESSNGLAQGPAAPTGVVTDAGIVEAEGESEETGDTLDDLDVMPSLDSLEGEFAQSAGEQEGSKDATKTNVMGQDPETAAKAIQTWLRKDKKG
jgi:hypothetical protein